MNRNRRRISRQLQKERRKRKQQHKDALKEINVRINNCYRQRKNEKNPKRRQELELEIEGLERKRKMCVAKRRFIDEDQARLFSLNVNFDCNLRPYKCPYCGGYHLTSKPKNSKKTNKD